MTLGEKLSMYRKNHGMTQQELGEHLNISAQAVSKWENDLSEPDIATIKKLSELYQVSITEILDIENSKAADAQPSEEKPVLSEEDVNEMTSKITGAVIGEMNSAPKTLGFCTACGITVTDENLGEKEPKVLCAHCVEERLAEENRAAQAKIDEQERKKNSEEYTRKRMRFKRNASIITGLCVGIFIFIFIMIGSGDDIGFGIGCGLVLGYASFAFTAQMFFDGVVRNVLFDLAEKSIHFPGLIFSFDIDGIIWLIGMKILFGILGFLGAILFAILGFIVALVIAPFVYPFSLIRQNIAIKKADSLDFE